MCGQQRGLDFNSLPLQEKLLSSILPQAVHLKDSINESLQRGEFEGQFRRLHISREENVR